jgi:hypothetical protein
MTRQCTCKLKFQEGIVSKPGRAWVSQRHGMLRNVPAPVAAVRRQRRCAEHARSASRFLHPATTACLFISLSHAGSGDALTRQRAYKL